MFPLCLLFVEDSMFALRGRILSTCTLYRVDRCMITWASLMQHKVTESAHNFFVWFQSPFFIFLFASLRILLIQWLSRMAPQRRQAESVSVKESVLSYVL